jgi:hypothetical protein
MSQVDQRICAIRLPGTSRARFVDAADVPVSLGDWVVIDTGAGDEAGQIVVAPDQWTTAVSMDDVPVVSRCLEAGDLDALAETIELARSLIDQGASLMRQHAAGTYLTGLRLTLDRSVAIVVYLGPQPEDESLLKAALSAVLARPVILEEDHPADPETALLGGGPRRPFREDAETFQALLERRLDVLRTPGTFAPHGMPRLGTQVSCEAGTGMLIAVDIRHWQATVRLADSAEISVSVDSLGPPRY